MLSASYFSIRNTLYMGWQFVSYAILSKIVKSVVMLKVWDCYGPNSTWLDTTRLNSTRSTCRASRASRDERVERDEPCSNMTDDEQACTSSVVFMLLHNTAKMHGLDTSNESSRVESSRVESSQVEFGLIGLCCTSLAPQILACLQSCCAWNYTPVETYVVRITLAGELS